MVVPNESQDHLSAQTQQQLQQELQKTTDEYQHYEALARTTGDPDLKRMWRRIAADVLTHAEMIRNASEGRPTEFINRELSRIGCQQWPGNVPGGLMGPCPPHPEATLLPGYELPKPPPEQKPPQKPPQKNYLIEPESD